MMNRLEVTDNSYGLREVAKEKRKKTGAVSMLQIPNDIIRNKDMDSYEFSLYAMLKHMVYLNGGSNDLEFYHGNIKLALGICDQRTFKKALTGLRSKGIVENVSDGKSKSRTKTHIIFHEGDKSNGFTQLPTNLLLYKIKEIGPIGFKLLYYYESYIIRKETSKLFCFSPYMEIMEKTGFSPVTISKYNSILAEQELLSITKHKLGTQYEYRGNGTVVFDKYNNHYTPLVKNMD